METFAKSLLLNEFEIAAAHRFYVLVQILSVSHAQCVGDRGI